MFYHLSYKAKLGMEVSLSIYLKCLWNKKNSAKNLCIYVTTNSTTTVIRIAQAQPSIAQAQPSIAQAQPSIARAQLIIVRAQPSIERAWLQNTVRYMPVAAVKTYHTPNIILRLCYKRSMHDFDPHIRPWKPIRSR